MPSKTSARKSRERKPFWKKFGVEMQHVTDHIGHIINNSRLSEVVDTSIYGGLALLGVLQFNDLRGAIIGPVGLKLAMGGNIVGGATGVAMLASIAIAPAASDLLTNTLGNLGDPNTVIIEGQTIKNEDLRPMNPDGSCPMGYRLHSNPYFKVCIPE